VTMGNQVSSQLLLFGQSILLGLSIGVLYDVLRPFRLRWPRTTALLDGGYCLAVGAASFLFLLRRGAGELRGFVVLGTLGGAVLFFLHRLPSFFAQFGNFGRKLWPAWYICWQFQLIWLKNFFKKAARYGKKSLLFCGKNAIQ